MHARIIVTLKPNVLDPQGQVIQEGLARLDFGDVQNIRQGKIFDIQLKEQDAHKAQARLAAMCDKLLANTVIEDYKIEIL